MRYSIVVPIYKVEAYLHECIDSVLSQSFEDFELILVDDGSPDNCPVICDSYAKQDKRVKCVHKKNGGLVSARKAGLEIASGEYVLCLDGDDYWKHDLLLKVNNQVNVYYPDIVCFGYTRKSVSSEFDVPVETNRFGFFSRQDLEKEIYPKLIHSKSLKRFPPVVWAKAFRMELYRKYQNNVSNDISMGEDGACSYPIIANSNNMVIMDECLYFYRQVESSMTKTRKPLNWDNYDKVFGLYREEIDMSKCDFDLQVCRAQTHLLFDICKSQFYSKLPYKNIVKSIESHFIEHPDYDEAISRSSFDSFKMIIARIVLKYRIYPLLFIASRIL